MANLLNMIWQFIRALFGWVPGVPAPKRPPDLPEEVPASGEPQWLRLARADLGIKEIVGKQHNPAVLNYFRDAGFPEIDDDETAWCAGFANAMLQRCGYSGSKSLAARSFLTWGKELSKPYPGCVVIFWRVSPRSWQGHVAFYLSETATHIKVIGGNQSNSVSVEEYPKSQLLGYREPITALNSRTTKAAALGIMSAGATGTAILDSQTQIVGIIAVLKDLGTTMPQIVMITSALSILAYMAIIYARYDDNKDKGR
jgi:uncharacterized protein (TIGR02594 family)